MIDVTIEKFGRNLMYMWLGAIKINQAREAKIQAQDLTQSKQLSNLKQQIEFFDELSFEATARVIDKRFKASKEFLQGGSSANLPIRQKATINDKNIMNLMQQNALKAKLKYNNSVSTYNKMILDRKAQSSFRLIDIKKVV